MDKQRTLSAGTGATLRTKDSAVTLPNQYGAGSAYFDASNNWTIFGDLE